MKKLKQRIRAIVALAIIGWRQPEMFTIGAFDSMAKIMKVIIDVANTGQPMMFKLATVVANEQHDIVTIWAGKGASADPYDRIIELRNEIDELKAQLSDAIAKSDPAA